MKVEGSYELPGPRELVWSMLFDPEVLARILPGCKRLDRVGENRFEGALEIKMGPIQGTFDGTVEFTEIHESDRAHIRINGQGAPGFVNGSGFFQLEEKDDTTTLLTYQGDAQIGGRLAAVGQRLLDSSTKAIIQASLEGLEAEVRARAHPAQAAAAGSAETTPPAPERSQVEFAAGVVRHMVNDALADEEQRAKLRRAAQILGGLVILHFLYRLIRRSR